MRSGLLRTPLDFETYEEDVDEMGQPVEDWQFFCKAWAKHRALRGEDFWASQQAQSDISGELEIRYIPALVDKLREDIEKVRAKHGDRVYQIKSFFDPDERRKRLTLMVKESL